MTNYTAQDTTNAAGSMDASISQNMAAALCYLLGVVTGVVFLVLAPYKTNPRIRFHAFQAIFLAGGTMALAIAISIVSMMMPAAIALIIGLATMLLMLAYLGVWLFMMWKTYQGENMVLPVVGPLAKQYAAR